MFVLHSKMLSGAASRAACNSTSFTSLSAVCAASAAVSDAGSASGLSGGGVPPSGGARGFASPVHGVVYKERPHDWLFKGVDDKHKINVVGIVFIPGRHILIPLDFWNVCQMYSLIPIAQLQGVARVVFRTGRRSCCAATPGACASRAPPASQRCDHSACWHDSTASAVTHLLHTQQSVLHAVFGL